MYYPAAFAPNTNGRYDVTFADLPGCVSQGKNLEDAMRMAQEALSLHLSGMKKDGEKFPKPSTLEEARAKEEAFAKEDGYELPAGTLYQYVMATMKEGAPVRLSITLKPQIVSLIDKTAEELGLTRSGLIAVATREYCNKAQL